MALSDNTVDTSKVPYYTQGGATPISGIGDLTTGAVAPSPTESTAGKAASAAIGGGLSLAGNIAGGAMQAKAVRQAGEQSYEQSLAALDMQEDAARVGRVQADKARRLQGDMDANQKRNDKIGVRLQGFQQAFADRLRKLQTSRDNMSAMIETSNRQKATQDLVSGTLRGQ